jgi:outer membrane autotransporter protein
MGANAANLQIASLFQRLRSGSSGNSGTSLYADNANPLGMKWPGTASIPALAFANAVGAEDKTAQNSFDRRGFFVNGQGSWGDKNATANERGYDSRTGGVTAGFDYRVTNNFVMGTALGYLYSGSDYDNAGGNAKAQSYNWSLFATFYPVDSIYVDVIAFYGYNRYRSDRNIPPGGVTANGDTSGHQGAISLATGYTINRGAFSGGPYVRGTWTTVKVNGFDETGAGALNTHVDQQTLNSLTSDLGFQFSYAISTAWGVISPNVRVEWEHQYSDNSVSLSGTLLSDPLRQSFTVATDEPDRNYYNIGAGIAAQFAHGRSGFIAYEQVVGRSDFSNRIFTLGLKFEF